ncbi:MULTISPECIES: hypothetical protein [unclassified Roseateles]|uniref:hypothetical protein n=1 Tax=unclassified Roseateles TaxID=2626991 RepID=UPI0007020DD5|nr:MULTISPECIES: hypothetical protein [unclassified Roseateles]KQW43410.1 hypothetical protein ASC81_16670 [Pelomonas sp. Root405]KRA71148.1 hypothetical protein ASD88_15190 [Pelomonas sp. Root662]
MNHLVIRTFASASGALLSFHRRTATQPAIIKFGNTSAEVNPADLPASSALQAAYPAGAINPSSDAAGHARVTVPAQSLCVYTHPR